MNPFVSNRNPLTSYDEWQLGQQLPVQHPRPHRYTKNNFERINNPTVYELTLPSHKNDHDELTVWVPHKYPFSFWHSQWVWVLLTWSQLKTK